MKGWKEVGTTGDINPVDYGGGVIFKHPQGHYFLLVTPGFEDAGDDSEDAELQLYNIHLPSSYEALKSDLDWVDFEKVFSSIGADSDEIAQRLGALRVARGAEAAVLYSRLIEDVAGYYGWHELDHYPRTETARNLRKILESTSRQRASYAGWMTRRGR